MLAFYGNICRSWGMCVAGRNTQEIWPYTCDITLSGLHEWSVYQHRPHAEQEAEAVNIAGNITNVEAEASASDSLVLPTIFLAILLMC